MRNLFENTYTVEVVTADISAFLDQLSGLGVVCKKTRVIDDLTIRFQIFEKYMNAVSNLAERIGVETKIIGMSGPIQIYLFAKKRAVLMLGVVFMIILTLYIPSRILFIEVDGNTSVSTQYILDQAEQIGIRFGTERKSVRSENIKNALLQLVPEIKWAGINTYGCRAVITVTEREMVEHRQEQSSGAQGIYALRDGIISNITVIKGTPVCRVGQAVNAGQLLVSGYTDCGLHIRAEQAQGRVEAITQHKIHANVPVYSLRRTSVIRKHEKWSVQFGKKRIKLYNSSGNYTPCCGKIYETYHLSLPGGFQLPVSLIKETTLMFDLITESRSLDEHTVQSLIQEHIFDNMFEGRILCIDTAISNNDDIINITGIATCEEIIGRIQIEEIDEIDS